ncbi:MAG: PDZ domain-containing protein [Polyangiales bacterium]
MQPLRALVRPSLVFFVWGLVAACGASNPPRSTAPVAVEAEPAQGLEPPPPGEPAPQPEPLPREQAIARADLVPVLDAGLGRFLQGVSTEASLADGRFVGFRIVSLYPNDPRFRGVDLRPGDVVTRINGTSIERPEGAFQVWNGLRVSSELMIEYLRDGERRELRYPIVD